MVRDYKKIKAWQLADNLALVIYKATKNFPKSELWGITSQMRRAAVSVPANIIEGSARRYKNEYLQFLYTAIASLAELGYYIKFSKDIGYVNDAKFEELNSKYEETVKVIRGLIRYIERSNVYGLMSELQQST
jgi:four helix bundle protein